MSVFVLLTIYFSNRLLQEADQALDARGRDVARHLAVAAEFDDRRGDLVALKRQLDGTTIRPEVLGAGVLQPDG